MDAFLYYDTKNSMEYKEPENFIWKELEQKWKRQIQEQTPVRTVYSNNTEFLKSLGFLKSVESVNQLELNILEKNPTFYEIYYFFQGTYHLFLPTGGKIVTIGHQIEPDFRNTIYENSNIKKLEIVLKALYDEIVVKKSNITNITYQRLSELEKRMKASTENKFFVRSFIDECLKKEIRWEHRFLLIDFAFYEIKEKKYYSLYCRFFIETEQLSPIQQYWLWFQIRRKPLDFPNLIPKEGQNDQELLYQKLYEGFYNNFQEVLQPIPLKNRNKDLIIIMTTTFLGERHAPSRTVLERCYTLGKCMKKRILLINTREYCAECDSMMYYKAYIGRVVDDYSKIESYTYKDVTFPFFQPDVVMPNFDVIGGILNLVQNEKPYFILSIGTGSITADLCSSLVPVLSMSVTFSALPVTKSPLRIIGKTLKEWEWKEYEKQGFDRNNIIETTFTFDLVPKKSTYTRKMFDLPEDVFLMAVVGIRLDSEIDEMFLKAMEQTYQWNTHLVFAGKFERYDSLCEENSELKKHSTYLGFCDDVLALMEICNFYVNPKRIGGGFSIIEAFQAGIPGVSLNYGDVAAAAGDEFCTANYEEMVLLINKYIMDKDFYLNMSQKARKRAEHRTDSFSSMKDLIQKAEKSKYFF